MKPIQSTIDSASESFAVNRQFMSGCIERLREVETKMIAKEMAYGPRAATAGKLLPYERLSHLLDKGAPFLELSSIAGYQMFGDEDGSLAGGNIKTGIGFVCGRRVLVMVWNYAVKGGTISSVTTRKNLRLQEIAFRTRLPIVSLSESGGGNLADRDGGDPWRAVDFLSGGRVYCQQAELSAAGITQVTVAHGNATAGGAYQVALSDYIVLVRNQSQIFLAGPPLLKAATGEDADHNELGGAEMHASISGTGEYLAENDADGIRIARDIVAQLPANANQLQRDRQPTPPLYGEEELIGLVPQDQRTPYDMREVIARIVDGSEFLEFQAERDEHTICGHAYLNGWRCGVITNNGPITPPGALKASQFLQLCDQSNTPMLFLQNTTGFIVGIEAEQLGQVKHGSKMIQAVANFRPPKLTVIVGNSYGAGNYAMCSQALKPDFCFVWPTSKIAVMGGQQAAKVMAIITEAQFRARGAAMDEQTRRQLELSGTKITEHFARVEEAMYTSARLMDDGLIDPRDTRKVIGFCLDTLKEVPLRSAGNNAGNSTQPNTFGVSRF